MLVGYLLVSLLYYNGNCIKIPIPRPTYNEKLFECLIDIIKEYISDGKVITYVGHESKDEGLLQAINTANVVTLISRRSSQKLSVPHQAYLISARNATYFSNHFGNITKESTWNPMARFLIVVKNLKENQLRIVFDTFLRLHVNNVVVVNATEDAHLYSYNPFNNYGCGKHYDTIVSYGKCSDAHTLNLYPEKIVTGLRNCTFNVQIPQWPPYTIIPKNDSNKSAPLRQGAETYLFRLISEMQGFNINIISNDAINEEFSTVSSDMEAIGSLKKLQDNETDIIIGGMLLTPSRAGAFDYIFGHLSYTDEIRFVVKRASFVRPWRNLYLEFESTVWVLLMLTFAFYSMLIIFLLRAKDKSNVVLLLLDNLALHGSNIKCRWTVKCVLILWVWFAYLVNTFYQSNLFSLTTNPAQEYQISNEEDIDKYQLKPCFSLVMQKYYIESVQSQVNEKDHRPDGCYGLMESVQTVIKSKDVFTILLYGLYQYNEQEFFDEYGKSQVVALLKPYSKVIYTIYVYKGFPYTEKLRHNFLQLRENGVAEKVMSDINYLKQIKHLFRKNEFRAHFAIPWLLYVVGCALALITFVIEIISKHLILRS